MTAPNLTKQFNDLRNKLFKLNRAVCSSVKPITSINELTDTRNDYVKWLLDMRDLTKKRGIDKHASALWTDEAVDHHAGAKIVSGEEFFSTLLGILQKETRQRISLLDDLATFFYEMLLEKHKDIFYFKGRPLNLNLGTGPYRLLDILFAYGDKDGFVSYDDILTHWKKQEPHREDVVMTTIYNAQTSLFRQKRLDGKPLENLTPSSKEFIEVRQGKGLILNNEPWN